ncbi:predicted protein [Histoplasma capsulatum var. duboisii H88]|uniref:Predicted protein n=1 Tax=Ajellomyces capsulatus (strain H88) TaxID=544711 RepID=F0UHH4_AJEC8|nr:predicted protein [Histoplasma capsulatum var. duboisii H88]
MRDAGCRVTRMRSYFLFTLLREWDMQCTVQGGGMVAHPCLKPKLWFIAGPRLGRMSFAYCFQSPNEGKVHTNYRMLKHCIHAHVRNGMLVLRVKFSERAETFRGMRLKPLAALAQGAWTETRVEEALAKKEGGPWVVPAF